MAARKRRRVRGSPEQAELAERWLRRTGREVTPQAVEELAPHVRLEGRPELLEVRAFARLVRLGQVPTPGAVQAEMAALTARDAQRRRLRDTAAPVTSDTELPTVGRAAADFARQHRERTGSGPPWSAVAGHLGLTRDQAQSVMRRLHDAGWLVYNDEPGSLRPGPAAHEAGCGSSL